jgi:ATP-dependent DNA helicase DinG
MSKQAPPTRAFAVLGDAGPFAKALDGFRPRVAQQEMAQAIEHCIETSGQLIAEAGTGTGKTYAYLVPALLSGKKTIISTGTKALQDQLFHRDLPHVRRTLGLNDSKLALLKGRANYVCLHRLERTIKEGVTQRELLGELKRVREWAPKSSSGDRAEIPGLSEDAQIWPLVTSNAENCLGAECPYWEDCYVVKARRRAQAADLVVVNHHLLFSDMAIRREGFGEVLPGAQLYVLDEAHQIADSATTFFSTTVSYRQFLELGRDVQAEAALATGALALLREPAQHLEKTLKDFRLSLSPYAAKAPLPPVLAEPEVASALQLLAAALTDFCGVLTAQIERSDGLKSCAARADELAARLHSIITFTPAALAPPEGDTANQDSPAATPVQAEEQVRWYELFALGFALHATPLDVAAPLAEFRAKTGAAWVYTSATLAVGSSFEHFKHETGAFDAETLRLDSPFDYAKQALLYLPKLGLEPTQEGYTQAVLDAAIPVLQASQGRAFVLFTSHRALKEAADYLATRIAFPIFAQGSVPRGQLLAQFQKSGNGVLLGAASFWEGVDVPGDALSVVIIDKLPFRQIGDPVLEAKLEDIRARGGNPFAHYQLPQAVLTLKQGVGRLIRTVSDRGVLMLCDPRLASKAYGRTFLNALPAMTRTDQISAVSAFFKPAN